MQLLLEYQVWLWSWVMEWFAVGVGQMENIWKKLATMIWKKWFQKEKFKLQKPYSWFACVTFYLWHPYHWPILNNCLKSILFGTFYFAFCIICSTVWTFSSMLPKVNNTDKPTHIFWKQVGNFVKKILEILTFCYGNFQDYFSM